MTGPSILYPALTQPVLTAAQQPEQVTESRWHQPLSQPVLRVGLSAAVVASGLFWSGFTPAPRADTWHQPLSRPVLRAGPTAAIIEASSGASYVEAPPFPESVSVDRWQQPLSQPVARLRVAEESALSYAYFVPSGAEVVTVDKWLAPFGQPLPTKGPSASLVASSGESYTHFVTASIEWHQPLSQQPISRWRFPEESPLSYAYFVSTALETVTVDKWLRPLSIPVRQPRATEFPALSYSYTVVSTPPAGTTTVYLRGMMVNIGSLMPEQIH